MAHVAAGVAAAVGGIVLRNTLNFYTNPRRRLLGEDARMRDADFHCNYVVMRLRFAAPPPKFEARVRNWVRTELENPRSIMRTKRIGKRHYEYDERDVSTLVPLYCRRVTTDVILDDVALESMALENSAAMFIAYSDSTVVMVANHQFADGMCAMQLGGRLWDGDVGHAYIPKFRYIPLVTEIAMLRGGIPFGLRRGLRYVSWTIPNTRGATIYEKRALEDVKRVKRRCGTAFNSVIASAVVRAIFDKVPTCTRLSLGVIVAFANKRRFNNFGLIGVTVRRPVEGEDPDETTRRIDRSVARRKREAIATYVIGNVYNLNAISYGELDVLVSGFPIAMRPDGTLGDITVGGVPLDTFDFSQAYSSAPVYVGHLSTASDIHISMTLRCPDLSDDLLKSMTL
jgi:hypothetical protein